MQSILSPLIDLLTQVLDWLHGVGLTWGLSIIGLTIIVRLILFPLTWKQYKSSLEMQAIQPQIKALQAKYKSDRGKLQEETMKLYQEHHVNPFASCLPLVLQLPVFLALYYTIRNEEAIAASTFLGIPLGEQSVLLMVVYVVTQVISTELMLVTQTDQMQKWLMRAMPIIFVAFLWSFPAGLFVYWITTNLWTIGQQLIIRRTMPKPEELAARAKAKPKKRSRFMEAIMASQSEAMRQREEAMAKKKAASGSGAAKQGAGGAGAKKAAPGGRKPPPGKGKRKGQPQGKPRPGQPQGKPRPGQPQGKSRPASAPGKSGQTPAKGVSPPARGTDDQGSPSE